MTNHLAMIVWGLLCIGLALPIGFAFGVLHERRRWNDLIDRGVIPKPRQY